MAETLPKGKRPCKILTTILKMDKGRNPIWWLCTRPYIRVMTYTDYMCQEKGGRGVTSIEDCKYLRSRLKRAKKG